MVTRETLERVRQELSTDVPIPPEDWEAVVAQVRRMVETVRTLDEMPLGEVEPAPLYEIVRSEEGR